MCNKRVSISYEVVRANIIIKQINFFSLSLKIDTYHSHKIKISKAQTQTKSNSKIPNTTMMMFRNSNLVLLAVIAASCTTFSTAVDGQSLLRRHLQDEEVDANPSDVTSTEDQAEVDSNMGSDVADPSNADASEDTVTSTEDGQENASGMDGKESEDGSSADDSSTDSDASNANASVNTVTSTEDSQEAASGNEGDASIGPGQEGQVAAAAMGESDSSYVADPSTSSAYVSYSMATAAATAAIITGTVMYL